MMTTCAGIKRDGGRCTATVEPPQQYCFWHDPANADKRRRAASKGGKGKASSETRDIRRLADDLTERALRGDLEPPVVHAVVALQNIKLRAIEQERKVKELEDVLVRIEALEEKQRQSQPIKGARRR